jgi:hypothetical protein
MGILYYVVYNPGRKKKPPLEVYKLEQGEYILQRGEPVLLDELKLGIGREKGSYQGIGREWLYWYDEAGKRYLTPEERIQEAQAQVRQAQQQSLEAQQRAKKLEERLRSLGINSDEL